MGKVFISLKVGTSSKDNSGKMREMGLAHIIMKMVIAVKDNIKMGGGME